MVFTGVVRGQLPLLKSKVVWWIERSKMDERRRYKRFPVQLITRYLEDDKDEWKECAVTNISREGMGIGVYSREKIHMNSILQLEIVFPEKNEPIGVTGTLEWIRKLKGDSEFNFVGGVNVIAIDPEDKWALLDYAYEDWSKKENETT